MALGLGGLRTQQTAENLTVAAAVVSVPHTQCALLTQSRQLDHALMANHRFGALLVAAWPVLIEGLVISGGHTPQSGLGLFRF